MASIEERLERVEGAVERLAPSIADRLASLEKATEGHNTRGTWFQKFLRWMGAELPKFVTGLVILAVGYWLKDSLDLAIKERQLDLSYVKEMQVLVSKLELPATPVPELDSAAVQLAWYGAPALAPLLNELRSGGSRANAASKGLGVLALVREAKFCPTLLASFEHSGPLYPWDAQAKLIRLLGDADCRCAVGYLASYRESLKAAEAGKPDQLAQRVGILPSGPDDYKQLEGVVDGALRLLRR